MGHKDKEGFNLGDDVEFTKRATRPGRKFPKTPKVVLPGNQRVKQQDSSAHRRRVKRLWLMPSKRLIRVAI
jgi:hypothetical protein